ncbi:hypothetical protein ACHWQZ_G014850 [Mnemiopsis leidyi]
METSYNLTDEKEEEISASSSLDKMTFCMDNPFSIQSIDVVFGILCVLFAVVGVVGNSAAVHYIRRSRKKNSTLTIFLHVAVTDLITSVFSTPLSAVIYLNSHRVPCMDPALWTAICNITGVLHSGMARASVFIVTVLSVSRFVAVYKPMSTRQLLSKTRIKGMLISAWSLAAFLAFFPFFFGKIYEYKVFIPTCYYEEKLLIRNSTVLQTGLIYAATSLIPFLVPGIVTTTCTLAVLLSLRKNARLPTRSDNAWCSSSFNAELTRKQDQIRTRQSAAVTTGIILGMFTFCYLPWWINSALFFLNIVEVIPEDTFTSTFGVKGWSYMLSVKVLIMVYLNSAANPVIYYTRVFTRGIVRRQYKKRVSELFTKDNPSNIFSLNNRGVPRSNVSVSVFKQDIRERSSGLSQKLRQAARNMLYNRTNYKETNIDICIAAAYRDSRVVEDSAAINNHCVSDDSATSRDALTSECNNINNTLNIDNITHNAIAIKTHSDDLTRISYKNQNPLSKDCDKTCATSQFPIITTQPSKTRNGDINKAERSEVSSETILNNISINEKFTGSLRLPGVRSHKCMLSSDTVFMNPLACRTWSSDMTLSDSNKDHENHCYTGYESV